jgi:hypothetical protein
VYALDWSVRVELWLIPPHFPQRFVFRALILPVLGCEPAQVEYSRTVYMRQCLSEESWTDHKRLSICCPLGHNRVTMAILAEISQFRPAAAYALLGIPVVSVALVVLYRVFLHPLANFPGPLLAKFTDLYPMVAMVKRNREWSRSGILRRFDV